MYFTKNFDRYCISENLRVHDALKHFEQEKIRTAICVDSNLRLRGSLSFGDFNRWVLADSNPDLSISVSEIMNRNVHFVKLGDYSDTIPEDLKKFKIIPFVDNGHHLSGVYTLVEEDVGISIGNFLIAPNSEPLIIAEIGNNHNGSLENAKELVRLAAEAGAHSAKFQLRDMGSLYGEDVSNKSENLGTEYTLDLLRRFQLTNDELQSVMNYARSLGLIPLCTPWDEASVDVLEKFGVAGYKLASADLTNHNLLKYVAATGKPMLCSTGMATEVEIIEAVQELSSCGAQFILLHCNSTYPAPFKDVNLKYISRLEKITGRLVGYSGHERDVNVAIAAVALGAKVVEKHFTTDRNLEGNDHKVSLLPDEFSRMVDGISQVNSALGSDRPRDVTQGEMMNRVTLAKSIYAAKDLSKGTLLTNDDIVIKSPGRGLQPNYLNQLMERPLKRSLSKGDVFYADDLNSEVTEPKSVYSFWSKWGIPVRHHDFVELYEKVNSPIIEFHLSYRDLDLEHEKFLKTQYDTELIVHAPELFFGDHTLDLSSPDIDYRLHSLSELQKTINVVRELRKFFPNGKGKVGLITNIGGFSSDGPLPISEKNKRTDILKESLQSLLNDDVEILPQTMPPFPWHFGGQQFHNLFLDGEWINAFCADTGVRVCLDISHSALECTYKKKSFSQFLDDVMPHTAHLHLADALGVDGEGLQIGAGSVDWGLVSSKMREHCEGASWIPEIWQGHENSGQGFWISLNELERFGF